ncbi:unnamed protein product [Rangifer tarandus platyrhynchus]|uniref:Uncharacterized protein n=2 Tax=Rangifer tarandus platyrhynchus TaxID=3082113 RepID=A0AC59ZYH4_RANTA|nr:unnamed protein product [Rangifer tarandus platyrhynchus]
MTSRSGLLSISVFIPCIAPEMGCVLLVSFIFATSHSPPQQTHQIDHSPLYLKPQFSFVNPIEACCDSMASAWHSGHGGSGSSLDLRLGSLFGSLYATHTIIPYSSICSILIFLLPGSCCLTFSSQGKSPQA